MAEDVGRRIVGIDPGLNITGYGVISVSGRTRRVCEGGVVRGGRGELGERLKRIHTGITEVLDTWKPDAVAVEELFSHYKRPRTAILMGHARGVICLAAAQAGVEVVAYAATQVKRMLTGHGRAPKMQVQQAICRELGLAQVPEPPDVADALALAMCHQYFTQRTGVTL